MIVRRTHLTVPLSEGQNVLVCPCGSAPQAVEHDQEVFETPEGMRVGVNRWVWLWPCAHRFRRDQDRPRPVWRLDPSQDRVVGVLGGVA